MTFDRSRYVRFATIGFCCFRMSESAMAAIDRGLCARALSGASRRSVTGNARDWRSGAMYAYGSSEPLTEAVLQNGRLPSSATENESAVGPVGGADWAEGRKLLDILIGS